jgi:hypothetical protein
MARRIFILQPLSKFFDIRQSYLHQPANAQNQAIAGKQDHLQAKFNTTGETTSKNRRVAIRLAG